MIEFFVFTFSAALLIYGLCGWWAESRFKIIAGALTMLMANQLLRVYPAFLYDYVLSGSFYVYFVFTISFVSILAGYFFSSLFLSKNLSICEYHGSPILTDKEVHLFVAVFIIMIASALPSIYLYQSLSPIIEGIFKGALQDIEKVGELRKEITKDHIFGGEYKGQGLIRIFNSIVWPFLLSISIVAIKTVTKKTKWILLCIILSILTLNFLSADGTRGALINVLVLLFITTSIIYDLKPRHVILIISLIFLFAIFISLFSPKLGNIDSDNFLSTSLLQIADRIFLGNALNDVHALTYVNEGIINIRYGSIHVRDLYAALPGVSGGKPFAYELFLIKNPGSSASTYSTGTYITKLYVDFGIFGVGAGFLLIGVFSAIIQNYLLGRKKTLLNVSITAFTIFLISGLVLYGPINLVVRLIILVIIVASLLIIVSLLSSENFSHDTLGERN